jgi:O-acetyl-ADP-ribose deacetylase (regulator of RNase III)
MTEKKMESSVVVVRRGGELDWWWAVILPIYSAQARLITHGETVEILGYYPNITLEQRIRIFDAHLKAEGKNP